MEDTTNISEATNTSSTSNNNDSTTNKISQNMSASIDSFKTLDNLSANNKNYKIYNLQKLASKYDLTRLPFSIKILLENVW